MGARRLIPLLALAACPATPPAAPTPQSLPDKVVADFEKAVLTSKDAYVDLFDFVAVGEFEILLHRYDLMGRLKPGFARQAEFEGEDGTPYPPTREKRNVGNFYPIFVQRTVGTGKCTAAAPRTRYARLLGTQFEPLPAGTPPGYDKLRADSNGWLQKGGVVAIQCAGGTGSLAVVYTERANARGYDLITIYDD
jgi:hypothetical protein